MVRTEGQRQVARAVELYNLLAQLDGYLDGLGLPTGWLVIFDERPEAEPTAVRTRRELATGPRASLPVVIHA